MSLALILLNVLVAIVAVWIVASQNRRDEVPLFCARNIFVLGFLFFQNFGIIVWLLSRRSHGQWAYKISDPGSNTTLHYIGLQILCLAVLFFAYQYSNPRFRDVARANDSDISNDSLMIHSVGLSIMGTIFWAIGFVLLKDLMNFVSAGVGATASGIAAYGWFRNRQDAFMLLVLLAVSIASCLPHLTEYGRRGLLSLALIVAWVGHFHLMVKVSLPKLTLAILLVTSPMLILLAAFSEARVRRPRTVSEAVEYMWNADIMHGLGRLANFQGSAVISMWCMENYPKRFPHRHLYSARATVHYFVPRGFWKDKPPGLGIQIPGKARLRNVGGLNVGAGLIGHAMAEGGIYALFVYSVLIGYGLKWMDNYAASRAHYVFAVPMYSGLGQLFATPRGEVNFFIDTMLIGIVMSLVCMKVMNTLSPWVQRRMQMSAFESSES